MALASLSVILERDPLFIHSGSKSAILFLKMPIEPTSATRTRWKLLLILPYLGLCFPALYARATPTLIGFPFFYWYQFAWVILASALMAIVYKKLRY